jgi:hypothetical protein
MTCLRTGETLEGVSVVIEAGLEDTPSVCDESIWPFTVTVTVNVVLI